MVVLDLDVIARVAESEGIALAEAEAMLVSLVASPDEQEGE